MVLSIAQSGFSPLPTWVVMPIALIALLGVIWHMAALGRSTSMPRSRRRIRLASSAVMLLLIPVSAAALSLIPPEQKRAFVLIWMAELGLLFIVIMLAALDMLDTHRMRMQHAAALRRDILSTRGQLLTALAGRIARAQAAADVQTSTSPAPLADSPTAAGAAASVPSPASSSDPANDVAARDKPS